MTYANLDGWTPSRAASPGDRSELDRWIISELNRLTARVTDYLENWRPHYAAQAIEEFTDGLSNWYVRRSRRRYWKSEDDGDKQAAYSTLYTCLSTLAKILAPFTPFVADEMYNNLVAPWDDKAPESVHLTDWPTADDSPDRRAVVGPDKARHAPGESWQIGSVIGRAQGAAAAVRTGGRASS